MAASGVRLFASHQDEEQQPALSVADVFDEAALYARWQSGAAQEVLLRMYARSHALFRLVCSLRHSLSDNKDALLMAAAPLLPPLAISLQSPVLRRLSFVTQTSALLECAQLRQRRLQCSIEVSLSSISFLIQFLLVQLVVDLMYFFSPVRS